MLYDLCLYIIFLFKHIEPTNFSKTTPGPRFHPVQWSQIKAAIPPAVRRILRGPEIQFLGSYVLICIYI